MKRVNSKLNLAGVLLCLLFAVPVLSSSADLSAVSDDVNSIEKIEIDAAGVKIHLKSSRPFPVRAIPPVMQVGSKSFDRSVRSDNGELNSLIFLLSARDYAQLNAADPVRVVYGQGESPREKWEFGVLRK